MTPNTSRGRVDADPIDGRTLERATVSGLLVWGLLVWGAVALSIRLVGHLLLSPTNPLLVIGFFATVIPLNGARYLSDL